MQLASADSTETQRLLHQAQLGEPGATDRLFDRHRAYLRRLVELRLDARVRARVDPSDVVQEAQLEAARRLDDYLRRPALPFRLWLRKIAYDRLLMLHRQHLQAARRTVARDVALPDHSSLLLARQLLGPQPSPSQQLLQRELARRVREALSELPEVEREVLVLRNLEGLSNLEVARVLQTDPATTSRRYGRAVIRLREVLRQSGLPEH
jgi:RNA polymerase sigma-70 factor (ECF subfamily)